MNLGAILLSVLVVGHSLFGQTGPRVMQPLLQAGGHGAQLSGQIINGAPARYNWDNGDAAKGNTAREVRAQVAGGEQTPEVSLKMTEAPVPETKGTVGIGLAAVNDWSVQQPFLDVMKTARPWIVHKPGQWGGAGHAELVEGGFLDEDGWPKRLPRALGTIGTVILTNLPEAAGYTAGRYRLAFEGRGVVEVGGARPQHPLWRRRGAVRFHAR